MAKQSISESEWKVMEVVWKRSTVTAANVIEDLSATDWNHRTIRTLLSRLVEKGALSAEIQNNKNVYQALVDRKSCILSESRSFAQRIFGGDMGELLVHFLREEKLSPDQLQELQEVLSEKSAKPKRKKRGK